MKALVVKNSLPVNNGKKGVAVSTYERKVFSFECDIYGHLNNAAYLKIYEEARSIVLDQSGFPLEDLMAKGISLYLTDVTLKFIREIKSGTLLTVKTAARETTRVRFNWFQEMFNPDGELCSMAIVNGAFVRNGRPARIPAEILSAFSKI